MKTMREYQRLKGRSPLHTHTPTHPHTHTPTHPHTHTPTHPHTHTPTHPHTHTPTHTASSKYAIIHRRSIGY
jgi:hypothetical protein